VRRLRNREIRIFASGADDKEQDKVCPNPPESVDAQLKSRALRGET
jgi:hypothetical protein